MNIPPEVRVRIAANLAAAEHELRAVATAEPDDTRRLALLRLADGVRVVFSSFNDLPASPPPPPPAS